MKTKLLALQLIVLMAIASCQPTGAPTGGSNTTSLAGNVVVTPTPTPIPTVQPTAQASPAPVVVVTAAPTPTPTPSPTVTPRPSPTATPTPTAVPNGLPVPTNLAVVSAHSYTKLTFSPVPNTRAYNILRGTAADALTQIGSTGGTSYIEWSVVDGTLYYYAVQAVSTTGTIANSATIQAMPVNMSLIGTPQLNGSGSLIITGSLAAGATSYMVKYSTTSGGAETSANSATCTIASNVTCTVSGLTNGTTYYFTVLAMNNYGGSQKSWPYEVSGVPSVSAAPNPTAAPPTSPTGTPVPVVTIHIPTVFPTPAPPSKKNLMGINFNYGATTDYSNELLFADVVKTSRGWSFWDGSPAFTIESGQLDENLWPTVGSPSKPIHIFLMDRHLQNDTQGTYTGYFTGKARIAPGAYALGGYIVGTPVDGWYSGTYDAVNNKTTFSFVITDSKISAGLKFDAPIKNLKIMRPKTKFATTSYPENQLFTDQAINLFKKFSVIRFMDYFHTNSSVLSTWSQRSLPTDSSINNGYRDLIDVGSTTPISVGGDFESAIAFCNTVNADMWLNIPLFADDDFVRKLANLIRYGSNGKEPYTSPQNSPTYPPLNANLNVYIEYSNEVWNTAPAFTQGNRNHDLAIIDTGTPSLRVPSDPANVNSWVFAKRRVGRRLIEISNIFRSVWGDADMPSPGKDAPRIRPVFSAQAGALGDFEATALTYLDQNFNTPTGHPLNYYLYGVGGSGYYGDDSSATIDTIWTSGDMDSIAWLNRTHDNQPNSQGDEGIVAKAFGLKRICYEGGPSFYANSAGEQAAIVDQQMVKNLKEHIDLAWSAAGGDLFVFYAAAGSIEWGFAQDIFNLNTPKLQAIDELNIQTKAAPTIGKVPPFTLNGIDHGPYFTFDGGSQYPDGTKQVMTNHAYAMYPFRTVEASGTTPATGAVTLTLTVGVGNHLYVYCDGFLVADIGPTSGMTPYVIFLPTMSAGLHAIMLVSNGGVGVGSLAFSTP